MSFQNLLLLSASVPKHKSKEDEEDKPKSLDDIINNSMK